ncbi:MAG TPA: ankyrin repeat domain-containing protein [Dongiaceae bacterium]|nr:ankyrin repeat domain-containing protein [Dongiaceae bacterium]
MADTAADQALLTAASRDDAAGVTAALGAGAAIDARDNHGQTALLFAVHHNDLALALDLIKRGADLNAEALNHDTPWLLAGALGHTGMLAAMLETGKVDYIIRNRYGGNALIPACERGHVDTVRLLLERSKIDVNHINNLGWTGLLEAVILSDGGARHVEIVRLLLAAGADPNIADKDGVTPLQHARERRYDAIATLIRDAGGK